ncbi:MAG: DUF624 domain-containing protein [Oscillospiraceae bacterium]
MALFGNYENSGSGIAKDAPQKKPFFRFWEIFVRKFWQLINVNLLMMASFLPLVLGILSVIYFGESNTQLALILVIVCGLVFAVFFGPIMAGCTQILRNFTREKPCFLMDTFFKTLKSNFKQSMLLGWIDILVSASVASGMYIYPRMIGAIQESGEGSTTTIYALFIATLSISIVVLLMSFYGYLMIVSTDLKMKDVLKNSLALSLIALKKNLITLVLSAVIVVIFAVLMFYFPQVMLVLLLFVPIAFVAFLVVFNCYPVIQKYVINPYYAQKGEISPELAYTQTEGENIFEDQGGKEKPIEAPVEPKKKGKKKKVIS